MAEISWIKLNTDMFDNRKIKYLRRLPDGDSVALFWVALLTVAGRCNAGGMIFLTENKPYTPEILADELDFEEDTVVLALNAMQELNMISLVHGHYSISGWEEHQNIEGLDKIREQNRLRKQKQRERQRLPEPNMSRDGHGTVTQCHATDKEEEKEEEKKEKKNTKAASPFDEILSEIESEELRQTYRDYIEMRKNIRSPMTVRALRLLINRVNSLETSVDGKCALLETAILNNWKSVYAPKEAQNGKNTPKNSVNNKRKTTGVSGVENAFWDDLQAMYEEE